MHKILRMASLTLQDEGGSATRFIDGVERVAGLTPDGLWAVIIVAALGVMIVVAYSLRNSGMEGLTAALHQLSLSLSAQIQDRIETRKEFSGLVRSISQIAEVLKDIQDVKQDIDDIRKNAETAGTKNTSLLESIELRLIRMEETLANVMKHITEEKKETNEDA